MSVSGWKNDVIWTRLFYKLLHTPCCSLSSNPPTITDWPSPWRDCFLPTPGRSIPTQMAYVPATNKLARMNLSPRAGRGILAQTDGLCPGATRLSTSWREWKSQGHVTGQESRDTDSSLLLAGTFACLRNMACVEVCKITATKSHRFFTHLQTL